MELVVTNNVLGDTEGVRVDTNAEFTEITAVTVRIGIISLFSHQCELKQ